MNTPKSQTRRDFVSDIGSGLGWVALASLLGTETAGGAVLPGRSVLPPFAPKAKRVIQLFMNGGASQCDLFDYKPELIRRHGKPFDPGEGARVEASVSVPGSIMRSPFEWAQHGASGRWVSSALPHTAKHVDKLAFLMAMTSPSNVHGPASYFQNSGFQLPGFPCLGAWVSHALGTLSENVPAFVALPDARGLPYNGRSAFTSGFLAPNHQGTIINAHLPQPITFLSPPAKATHITSAGRGEQISLLAEMNEAHAAERGGDPQLRARMESYQLAARLQLAAPELLDLKGESAATRRLYGLEDPATADFGKRCLLARRMVERGVRFVQVWSGHGGGSNNWDNHSNIASELGAMAKSSDLPTAALLVDLESRGLLEDTLLIWTTEFGRMPFSQSNVGRDHNGGTFVSWFAGAGIQAGASYGQSDAWSWKAERNITTCYDFHATILHLLGINHEKLTVRHNGIDRRITDVHGEIIHPILS